jgi:GH24 family phage-related lysozyme (muramidase)
MIKHHEGVKLKPYRCPAALWTVGVGHVLYPEQAAIKMIDRMALPLKPEHDRLFTAGGVDAIFRSDLIRFESGVLRLCPSSANSQAQFDALVSFSFNLGLGSLQSSTLRMKYNRGDIAGTADEFLKWNKAGGKVLKGLTRRREAERLLFLS